MSNKKYFYEFKVLCGAVFNFHCEDMHKYHISGNF